MEGVEIIEQTLRGLCCFSGLGNKSLISTVDDTLGFWHRESKLLEADDALRLRSARREEKEFSDIVELLLLWLITALGLCGVSSFSIGFCRARTCFRDVSDLFVRSRFLWIGTMSIISGVGSNVTEVCEPWAESCLKGLVSSTDIAWRFSLNIPGWRYPFSLDIRFTRLPCFRPWLCCFIALLPADILSNGLVTLPFSARVGTESLLEIRRAFDDDDSDGVHFGELERKEKSLA